MARWGMPMPPQYLAGKKVDRGVTNIRQTTSSQWRAWLGPEHRGLVPFTSFAENETLPDGSGCGSAWNVDPLSGGIGVQN